eukprot:scaffold3618_cov129-Cylindrotheca_fusiformis.AAC.16
MEDAGTAESHIHNHQEVIWNRWLDNFQGDFDNYSQVMEDRANGMLPNEGGGHENFHCTLVPLSKTSRLAAFYFDGNPERIFRFRYYELTFPPAAEGRSSSSSGDDDDSSIIEMKLYTLHPELERLLRSKSDEPLQWPSLYNSFQVKEEGGEDKIQYLPNCEIAWSLRMDPVEHSYAKSVAVGDKDGIHAVMVYGEAIVDSTIIPGMKIRILDQLSLYRDTFYINDRGLDPETGDYIYGNQAGVPYRLERVSRMISSNGKEREVVREDLKWTMGPKWRSQDEYEMKIKGIGGPSSKMNQTPKKS